MALLVAILGLAAAQPPPAPVGFDLKVVWPSQTQRSLLWTPKAREFKFGLKVEASLRDELERSVGPLIDPRFGVLSLGPPCGDPVPFVVSKTKPDRPWRERLVLDANRDGRFDPKREVYTAEAETTKARTTVEHRAVRIDIPYDDATVTHEFSIGIVYPKPGEEGDFDVIRLTRRSWMEGTVTIDEQRFRVALIDANNDGRFTRVDRWIVVPDNKDADAAIAREQDLGYPLRACFVWFQAYRLMDVTASASRAGVRLGNEKRPQPKRPPPGSGEGFGK